MTTEKCHFESVYPVEICALEKTNRDADYYPASFAQKRLWVSSQLSSQKNLYHIPCVLLVEGNFDMAKFEVIMKNIVMENEILRTTFHEVNGVIMQKINAGLEFDIQLFDEDIDESLFFDKQFDLQKGPLFRCACIKINEKVSRLLFCFHHIIMDACSLNVLLEKIKNAYTISDSECNKEPELQYIDYTVWQKNVFDQGCLSKSEQYWLRQIETFDEKISLPIKQNNTRNSNAGDTVMFRLNDEMVRKLKKFAAQNKVTLQMMILSIWQVFLYRYTGENKILLGSVSSGRENSKTQKMLGLFANTILLGQKILGSEPFSQCLKNTRKMCLEAYDHQFYPFEKLVEKSQPDRENFHSPFFTVFFNYVEHNRLKIELPELVISSVEYNAKTSKFDLSLLVNNYDEYLDCLLEYKVDLFDQEMIEIMAQHFKNFTRNLILNPDVPIDSINFLSKREIVSLLGEEISYE